MWEVPELWARFACLHVLQMELLNCGLEQCCWNARHWRRKRNEEKRREGGVHCLEGTEVKSALYSSQSHRVSNENSESLWFCCYWSQTSAVFLRTDVAHSTVLLQEASNSEGFEMLWCSLHYGTALYVHNNSQLACSKWLWSRRPQTCVTYFYKTVYFKMFFTLSMTMCLHSTYTGVGLHFIHKNVFQ